MVAETKEKSFGETDHRSAGAPERTPARLAAPQIQAGGGLASAGREFAHEVLSQVSPAPAPGEFVAADDKEIPNGSRSRALARSGRARASLLRETDPARSAVASGTTGMKGQYPALAPVPPETSPTVAPLQPERVAAVRAPVDLSPVRLSPARPSQLEPEPSIAGPDIRVTIGRVEVRAIPPPSPAPRRSSPAGPRLSLEDYLKKFAGRGR